MSQTATRSKVRRDLGMSIPAGVGLLFVILLAGARIAQAQALQAPDRVRVLISFRQNPGPPEEALVRALGGNIRYTYHLVPAIAATIPSVAIQPLQSNPRVASVEPDGEVQADDAELDAAWGVKHIGAGTIHGAGNLGTNVKVAIIDSGIDKNHSDLIGNVLGGRDFVNGDDDPMDDNGHGTHVAGTVAAKDDNAGVVGVAPEADLYALKVLNANGSGNWSDIIAALQWAVDNGIQVTNNSYGSSSNPGSAVQAAFDASYAAGVLHVASAGNSGNPSGKGDKVGYPARYASVIAVAATDSSNNRASFSSPGDAVEISAPGVAIYSTLPGGGYASWNGTSMASPHVAGTAALIIRCGIIGNAAVRARLQSTADDLGAAGRDSLFGFGLVDAAEAAAPGSCSGTPTNNAPNVSINSPSNGATFPSGTSVNFAGTASDTEDGDLTASLSWTSSINGAIGTGAGFSTSSLSVGSHTITASATDSGAKTGSASIALTVTSTSSGTVSVSGISYATSGGKNGDRHLSVTVQLNPAISGAAVSITLQNGGSSWPGSGTTGTTGSVTFTLSNAPSGTYSTTVNAVTAPGYAWDGITPANSFSK